MPCRYTPEQVHPLGCASGSSTGLRDLDAARCVIVGLTLPANNLAGTLPPLANMPSLQVLDVEGARLEHRKIFPYFKELAAGGATYTVPLMRSVTYFVNAKTAFNAML